MIESSKDEIEKSKTEGAPSNLFMTQRGERISLALVDKLYKLTNDALDNVNDYGKLNPAIEDQRVGEYLYNHYLKLVSNSSEISDQKVDKSLVDAVFLWRCKWENIEKGCANIFDLSLKNFGTYTKLPGSQVVKLKQGYKHVINALIDKQRSKFEAKLRLKSQLRKILPCLKSNSACQNCVYTQDQNKIVCMVTDELNHSDCVVVCRNVLCTMSLGFMKEHIEQIVEPSDLIPEEKLAAIKRVGFQAFHKIFLIYDEPFWGDNFEGLHLIQVPSDPSRTVLSLNKDKSWLDSICSIMPVYKQKKSLCAYVSDDEQVEQFDDEFIKVKCTNLIRKFMNRDNIPLPKDVKRLVLAIVFFK
jgi:hypothetical protein